MAMTARLGVMTTLFSCVAVDIVVPLAVLVVGVALSELIFVLSDRLAMRRRAA